MWRGREHRQRKEHVALLLLLPRFAAGEAPVQLQGAAGLTCSCVANTSAPAGGAAGGNVMWMMQVAVLRTLNTACLAGCCRHHAWMAPAADPAWGAGRPCLAGVHRDHPNARTHGKLGFSPFHEMPGPGLPGHAVELPLCGTLKKSVTRRPVPCSMLLVPMQPTVNGEQHQECDCMGRLAYTSRRPWTLCRSSRTELSAF